MKPLNPLLRILPPLALGAALTAQSWTEANAGHLPLTAETTVGTGPLQRIDGSLTGNTDIDMYLIHVDDPTTFRCTTVGGATWDTTLWMFHRDGRGIAFQEDDMGLQSTLTGQFLGGPGYVLIAITAWDNDPLDVANQQLWQDTPWNVERQPDGPGAANPVNQWDLLVPPSNPGGPYSMFLSGASFAASSSLNLPAVAWAWVVPSPTSATIVPLNYQHTPSGERITVDRLSQGRYAVNLPRLPQTGAVHACAYGGNHTVVVRDWYANPNLRAFIDVLDTNGAPVDQPFCIHYRVGGPDDMRSAYLWADNPTAPSYTPSPSFMWNGTRGAATITRLGTGYYRVTLPGLGQSPTFEYGNVQVSPFIGISSPVTARRAKVENWVPSGPAGDDLDVFVLTFNGAGAPVDSMFVLSYHQTAAPIAGDQGSGAHVLANNATAATYTPDGLYTDSNGAAGPSNAETITRVGTGVYDVLLPNVVSLNSTHAQVTAYGSGSEYATIDAWAVNGNGTTLVRVRTFNAAGAPVDTRFSLSYLTNRPARNAATIASVGSGCHGPVLRALNRPLEGTNWAFELTGLPATSLLGFMQLGLSNPNLPLGVLGAPACRALQDALVTSVLLLPISNPAYTFAIPNNPAFLGVNIFAQAGAIAPGVNAFDLALSNGIRGTLGNN
jgi:hypothetical protein